jgi:hypothetical protein
MALSVGVSSITKDDADVYHITFVGGMGLHGTLEQLKAFVAGIDGLVEIVHRLILGYWLARRPDGDQYTIIVGKTLTFDLANAAPIRLV